jgi:4a-hydroxytetrahydrobiopterin dehydratase
MVKLSESEILERLPEAKGWDRVGDELVRTWQFASARQALEFVQRVTDLAEQLDHHPDIVLSYRSVRVEVSTHAVGGLTDLDFRLVAGLNGLKTAAQEDAGRGPSL